MTFTPIPVATNKTITVSELGSAGFPDYTQFEPDNITSNKYSPGVVVVKHYLTSSNHAGFVEAIATFMPFIKDGVAEDWRTYSYLDFWGPSFTESLGITKNNTHLILDFTDSVGGTFFWYWCKLSDLYNGLIAAL